MAEFLKHSSLRRRISLAIRGVILVIVLVLVIFLFR